MSDIEFCPCGDEATVEIAYGIHAWNPAMPPVWDDDAYGIEPQCARCALRLMAPILFPLDIPATPDGIEGFRHGRRVWDARYGWCVETIAAWPVERLRAPWRKGSPDNHYCRATLALEACYSAARA
jgi:hypothetical protein